MSITLETATTIDEYVIASFLLMAKSKDNVPVDEPIWDAFFREANCA